jgi:hypothetical protein
MREPPGSQPETNLLTVNGVDSYGRDCISTHLIRNHYQLPIMTTDHYSQPRLGVEVSLTRVADDALKLH